MAVQFVQMKCPECGGVLPEVDSEVFYCVYCGTRVERVDDNVHVVKTVDEARIKEAETQRIVRLRELELEAKEKSQQRLLLMIAYGIALGFVLVGAIICVFNSAAGALAIFLGVCGAVGVFAIQFRKLLNAQGKTVKEKVQRPEDVYLTEIIMDYEGRSVNTMIRLLKSIGFTNVTAVALDDIDDEGTPYGIVESLTIGNDEFEAGDCYPSDIKVLVMYRHV